MLWITYTYISKRNSGKNLPIYVQVYYSFVDGIHIGEFVDSLENILQIFNNQNPVCRTDPKELEGALFPFL